jgi:2-octaprenyl-6-methoxyphenol hydroxylase
MSVIIAGGGMTGATLALALSHLSRGKLTVHLVEASEPISKQHPGFDSRAIALAQGTCQQLSRIGIWPALQPFATPINHIHVSDQGHAGMTQLHATAFGLPALGQVIELHHAGQQLFRLLQQAPGVKLHCPARVERVERQSQQVSVTLDNGEQLCAQLLVAADGSCSPVAAACQIGWQQQDYQQVAVIANVTTSKPHQGQAFERFTVHGPLALLPMSQGRSTLVWCHAASRQQQVDSWSSTVFLEQLQQAFGWRLGRLQQVGERYSYPLRLLTASSHISHRLALVGNAAQTLHPIAGQGFNLGMRDVMTLAETLVDAQQAAADIGSYRVLHQYQQRRQADQKATIGLTDGLLHLFANKCLPLVVARNLGLLAMDNHQLLREAFARRTLGWVAR